MSQPSAALIVLDIAFSTSGRATAKSTLSPRLRNTPWRAAIAAGSRVVPSRNINPCFHRRVSMQSRQSEIISSQTAKPIPLRMAISMVWSKALARAMQPVSELKTGLLYWREKVKAVSVRCKPSSQLWWYEWNVRMSTLLPIVPRLPTEATPVVVGVFVLDWKYETKCLTNDQRVPFSPGSPLLPPLSGSFTTSHKIRPGVEAGRALTSASAYFSPPARHQLRSSASEN